MATRALNFTFYYAGWLACILGPAWQRPLGGAVIALCLVGCHLALARRRRDELELMLWAGGIGVVVDTLQISFGTLTFPVGSLVSWLPPPWLIALWIQFAATFHYSMRWLQGRPLLAALFGVIGGPLAFDAGRRLGVVEFHPAVWPTLLALALVWSAVMPTFMWLAARQSGREGGGEYRSLFELAYARRSTFTSRSS